MDNFVIPAKTKKELEERTIKFLKVVEKYNLCFKQSKCDFNAERISIPEVVVGWGEVKAVKEMEITYQDKRSEKLLSVCQFLLTLY